MNILTFLQVVTAPLSNIQTAGTKEETLLSLAMKGGWVMYPIYVLSIIAVYIFVERYYAIKKAQKMDINFMNRIRDYIMEGKIDAAKNLCETTNNPVSHMIHKGISRIGRPLNDVSAAIENVGRLEILLRGIPVIIDTISDIFSTPISVISSSSCEFHSSMA